MLKPFALILGAISQVVGGDGFQTHSIDPTHPLTVKFSHTSHNRIAIEDGAVTKVVGDGALFSVSIDHSTGQAFVTINQPIQEQLSTLTVVSSTGAVQDLSVVSRDGPGGYLLLKDPETVSDDDYIFDYKAMTVDFLNTILVGDTPTGYGVRDLSPNDVLTLPNPLSTQAIKALEGPLDEIVLYKISNHGKTPISITPDSLKKTNHSWVLLTGHHLNRGEYTFCVVSTPKEGL